VSRAQKGSHTGASAYAKRQIDTETKKSRAVEGGTSPGAEGRQAVHSHLKPGGYISHGSVTPPRRVSSPPGKLRKFNIMFGYECRFLPPELARVGTKPTYSSNDERHSDGGLHERPQNPVFHPVQSAPYTQNNYKPYESEYYLPVRFFLPS
jgi:hypothetical protein